MTTTDDPMPPPSTQATQPDSERWLDLPGPWYIWDLVRDSWVLPRTLTRRVRVVDVPLGIAAAKESINDKAS